MRFRAILGISGVVGAGLAIVIFGGLATVENNLLFVTASTILGCLLGIAVDAILKSETRRRITRQQSYTIHKGNM